MLPQAALPGVRARGRRVHVNGVVDVPVSRTADRGLPRDRGAGGDNQPTRSAGRDSGDRNATVRTRSRRHSCLRWARPFAILAALTLANEAGYLSSAESIVSSEAGNAARLAWAATSPGVNSEPIHAALRALPERDADRRMAWFECRPRERSSDRKAPSLTWRGGQSGSGQARDRHAHQHRTPGLNRRAHRRPPGAPRRGIQETARLCT